MVAKHYAIIDDSKSDDKGLYIEDGPLVPEGPTEIPPPSIGSGGLTPLNQLCSWKAYQGCGSDGTTPQYTVSTIRCRFRQQTKSVLKMDGTLGISQALIRCIANVQSNDVITYNSIDYAVMAVKDILGIGGQIIEREVRL